MAGVTPERLARCLADIESGRMAVEQCLDAHPGEAEELRGLLEAALALWRLPPVGPDEAFRRQGRLALTEALAAEREATAASPFRRLYAQVREGWRRRRRLAVQRLAMPAVIVCLLALTTTIGGRAVYASQDLLPGDALYPVKSAIEVLQLAVAGSDEERARVHLDLAATRLAEIERAIGMGRVGAVAAAAEAFAWHVAQADEYLTHAAASGKDVAALVVLLSANLDRQREALDAMEELAPDEAQAALLQAIQAAEHGLTLAGSRVRDVPPAVMPPEAVPSGGAGAATGAATPTPTVALVRPDGDAAGKVNPLGAWPIPAATAQPAAVPLEPSEPELVDVQSPVPSSPAASEPVEETAVPIQPAAPVTVPIEPSEPASAPLQPPPIPAELAEPTAVPGEPIEPPPDPVETPPAPVPSDPAPAKGSR